MPVLRKYGFKPKKAGYTLWVTGQSASRKRSSGQAQKGLGDVLVNAAFRGIKESLRNDKKTHK